jgi:hypothetical protein
MPTQASRPVKPQTATTRPSKQSPAIGRSGYDTKENEAAMRIDEAAMRIDEAAMRIDEAAIMNDGECRRRLARAT